MKHRQLLGLSAIILGIGILTGGLQLKIIVSQVSENPEIISTTAIIITIIGLALYLPKKEFKSIAKTIKEFLKK